MLLDIVSKDVPVLLKKFEKNLMHGKLMFAGHFSLVFLVFHFKYYSISYCCEVCLQEAKRPAVSIKPFP